MYCDYAGRAVRPNSTLLTARTIHSTELEFHFWPMWEKIEVKGESKESERMRRMRLRVANGKARPKLTSSLLLCFLLVSVAGLMLLILLVGDSGRFGRDPLGTGILDIDEKECKVYKVIL